MQQICVVIYDAEICIDPPNTAVRQKNQCKCMVSRGLHYVPWEHGSHDALFPGNMMQPGNIVYFCTQSDSHWTIMIHITQIMI